MTETGTPQVWCAIVLCVAYLCAPLSARALDLQFPGDAALVRTSPQTIDQHPVATGPWTSQGVPTFSVEGMVQQSIWQITGPDITTASLLATLREQFTAQGYEIGFACTDIDCGGFDFRHALPVGNAPDMHVDLGDFHYFTASLTRDDGIDHLAVLISRGGATGFVHIARIQPPNAGSGPITQSSRAPDIQFGVSGGRRLATPENTGDLIAHLVATGSAALDDLRFQTGASELTGDRYASLAALSTYLADNTDRRIVLVGHTDAMGSLDGNIALSEARAGAVRRYLVQELGVSPAQVTVEGIGFLAPRATNTSDEGREANRRVEVVLTNPG